MWEYYDILFFFIQLHLIFSYSVKICEIWGQAKLLEFQRVCLRTCLWGDPNGSDSSRITMQYTVKRRSRPLAIFANTMQHACIDGIRDPILRGLYTVVDLSTTLSVYLHTVYLQGKPGPGTALCRVSQFKTAQCKYLRLCLKARASTSWGPLRMWCVCVCMCILYR